MHPGLLLLGAALIVAGFVGLLLPAVPGAPLVFGGILLIAWADGFARIGPLTLVAVALLGVLSWAVDYAAGVVGARRAGASRWGLIGAFLGLVVGVFFGLPGLLVGPAVGAMLFEYAKNPDFRRATRAGTGVFIGFLLGTALKCALAVAMVGLAAAAYFF
jgi:hypothetical protein